MKKYVSIGLIVAIAVFFVSLTFIAAQDFPTKPIRLVVPYSPGGSHDLLARSIQAPMGKTLGTTVVVEDVPGGATKVGSNEMLKAKPDGYTLLLMNNLSWVGYYYSKTYDTKPWEKSTPIGNLAISPFAFIHVRADAPFHTWPELVEYGKKNPGKLTCSGPSAGGIMEAIFTVITERAGIKARYVPFTGASPAQTALLGGHVDFHICTVGEAIAMVRAGKTRGIAITSDKRYYAVPDVPTFTELGLGDPLWIQYPIWGPANMPKNIVDKLAKAIEVSVKDPDFITLSRDKMVCIPEFKPGSVVKENTEKLDKTWGPILSAIYK